MSAADSLGFEALAQELLSTDNDTRSAAEQKYSKALEDDPASVVFALLSCLHHGQVRTLRITPCTPRRSPCLCCFAICMFLCGDSSVCLRLEQNINSAKS